MRMLLVVGSISCASALGCVLCVSVICFHSEVISDDSLTHDNAAAFYIAL